VIFPSLVFPDLGIKQRKQIGYSGNFQQQQKKTKNSKNIKMNKNVAVLGKAEICQLLIK
jgi:hypothetical protein